MIQVLIVDDEPKLREGLRHLIPWGELGYHVIATAANGYDALDKYRLHRPELLIVDIRMPEMDGLELIERLRGQGEECRVLILSGYADFEYAQKAISHRIDGYLLKPVHEEELISHLKQLQVDIAKRQHLKRIVQEAPAKNQEGLLRGLLQPDNGGGDTISGYAAALGLADGGCEVMLVELLDQEQAGQDNGWRVAAAAERHFASFEQGMFFSLPPYIGLLLSPPLAGQRDYDQLHDNWSEFMSKEGSGFIAAAGGAVACPEDAALSFMRASELLRHSFFYPKHTLIRSGMPDAYEGAKPDAPDRQESEHRLQLAVETGSIHSIAQHVHELSASLLASGSDEARFKETFVRALNAVLVRLEPAHPDIRGYADRELAPISALYQSHYLADLQEQVILFLESVSSQVTSGARGSEVVKMTELIHLHYNENLKLETLSELFNYNTAYLGQMFKNATGEYFNTYVDKVRIEKSKAFLAQGMKVYEVAEKIGYMNPDYFNAKFRKYEGVSPTSYRKTVARTGQER